MNFVSSSILHFSFNCLNFGNPYISNNLQEYCYGDISYHTPKMDLSKLSTLGENNFSFLTRHLKSRERLVLPLYNFLFSANTITFTYHPLFELFFHRCYMKTITNIFVDIIFSLNLFNRLITLNGLFDTKIWFNSKRVIITITIFSKLWWFVYTKHIIAYYQFFFSIQLCDIGYSKPIQIMGVTTLLWLTSWTVIS